jgi:hypothetical protein
VCRNTHQENKMNRNLTRVTNLVAYLALTGIVLGLILGCGGGTGTPSVVYLQAPASTSQTATPTTAPTAVPTATPPTPTPVPTATPKPDQHFPWLFTPTSFDLGSGHSITIDEASVAGSGFTFVKGHSRAVHFVDGGFHGLVAVVVRKNGAVIWASESRAVGLSGPNFPGRTNQRDWTFSGDMSIPQTVLEQGDQVGIIAYVQETSWWDQLLGNLAHLADAVKAGKVVYTSAKG